MTPLDTPPTQTTPPLVERLAAASTWVSTASLDDFLRAAGPTVLFLWSDPIRFPESLDVAVVLPELQRHFSADGRPGFAIGVVQADSEDAVARRFGAQRRPALVFLRDGQYVDTVDGMLDWDRYVDRVSQCLSASPRRAPSLGIPLVAAQGGPTCH